jgi:lysozyme
MALLDYLWSLISALFMPAQLNPLNAMPSFNGINFLKRHEGYRDRAYKDSNGNYTIGYGHKIVAGDGLGPNSVLTTGQAEALLLRDLVTAADAVRRGLRVAITQNQFDALVSFAFNIGAGGFANSEVLKMVNAGNIAGAARAWVSNWTTAGGNPTALLSRRTHERDLFLTP